MIEQLNWVLLMRGRGLTVIHHKAPFCLFMVLYSLWYVVYTTQLTIFHITIIWYSSPLQIYTTFSI